MFAKLTELDFLEFRLGYAHAILEVGDGTLDDEEWEDVNPDWFTVKSVKAMRRDCIMFLSRIFDSISISPEELDSRASFYDLGFQFYLARIGFSSFEELELGPVAETLDRLAEEEFGPVYPEISRRRIYYGSKLPDALDREGALASTMLKASRRHVSRCGLEDPDVCRGVQRHNYSRYA